MTDVDWSRMRYGWWSDLAVVRARLAAGVDPNTLVWPLHHAARMGSAEVVAELARHVDDVDAVNDGRTALWLAVHAGKPDNARALVAAGADPERPMMAGWSPARLSLAGATPDLFDTSVTLTEAEAAAVAEARRLIDALAEIDSDSDCDGMSLCCVGGIDAAEAVRRLDATVVEDEITVENMWAATDDESIRTLGVTNVPGGCVVSQPWGYGASMPMVALLLSPGTVCYGMYANPKSGDQGQSVHDGVITGWDLNPGDGWSEADASSAEVLRTFLYQDHPIEYCCAYAGVRPADARPFTEPDRWVRLPARDWWAASVN